MTSRIGWPGQNASRAFTFRDKDCLWLFGEVFFPIFGRFSANMMGCHRLVLLDYMPQHLSCLQFNNYQLQPLQRTQVLTDSQSLLV